MKRFLGAMSALILASMVWLAAIQLSFRRDSDGVHSAIKRFNRRFLNPVTLRFAGRKGFYAAALHHVGRKSGIQYATPVRADPTPDGFVTPLPYGAGTDWLKNVRAAGSAELVIGGTVQAVDRPQLISAAAAGRHIPARIQRQLDRSGVSKYLRLYLADLESVRSS